MAGTVPGLGAVSTLEEPAVWRGSSLDQKPWPRQGPWWRKVRGWRAFPGGQGGLWEGLVVKESWGMGRATGPWGWGSSQESGCNQEKLALRKRDE